MARPWRAGGDGRSVSIPALPWKEREKLRESERKEQERFEVEVHESGGESGHTEPYDQTRRWYFACTCGACGPLRRTQLSANTDGTIHELWHEQNPTAGRDD